MKKNIAILAGGNSSEAVISLRSAEQIRSILDKKKYNAFTIYVKGNEWVLTSDKYCDTIINKDDFSFSWDNTKIKFDFALIAIHGTPGEDGKLQSYFELLKIPYSTSDTLTSSVTFNKYACKAYLDYAGIPSTKSILIRKNNKINESEIINKLGLPCFVKPNAGGSSFGVSKVKSLNDLKPAIEKAFNEDNEIIIESFLKGIEVSCGIIKTKQKEIVFPITEIVSENEFFDYEAKYKKGKAKEITPARISKKAEENTKKLTSKIYDILNCKGVVRIDYMIDGNTPNFIEINTVPGMSAESIIPKQAEVYGLSMTELFTIIIEDFI